MHDSRLWPTTTALFSPAAYLMNCDILSRTNQFRLQAASTYSALPNARWTHDAKRWMTIERTCPVLQRIHSRNDSIPLTKSLTYFPDEWQHDTSGEKLQKRRGLRTHNVALGKTPRYCFIASREPGGPIGNSASSHEPNAYITHGGIECRTAQNIT